MKDILRQITVFQGLLQQGGYQVLSPVLFCLQVQLDVNEFQENNGIIQVNATGFKISVYDYIRMDDTHVRVCADDYLVAQEVSSGTGQYLQTNSLLCLSLICQYFSILFLM